jgi:two-component system phosphate regulon sensor histidine kinase PhoR
MTLPTDGPAGIAREGASELAALSIRAEALRERAAAGDAAPAELIKDLEHTLEEVREVHEQLVNRAHVYEELAEAERKRYQDLFDLAPDAYLVTDAMGKVLEVNHAFGELVGRDPTQIHGKPLAAYVHPDDRRAFRQVLLRLSRGETGKEWELRLVADLDRVVLVAARATPEAADEGVVLVRWLLRDVTQRRRWEDEIRALNTELELRIDARTYEVEQMTARLAAVLRELPEGVIIVGHGGEVQLANRRAQDLLEDADALATEAVTRALQGEETRAVRTELARGEELLVIEYATTPVRDAAGEVVAAVLTFQDVTERELRERAQRDFVTNAAHELQTPLAAIASAVQVLQAGAKDEVKTRDRFLDHIDQAVNRLDRLTRALLVLARAQTREEAPRHEVIELRPLLEEVASALRPSAVPVTVSCARETAVIANRPLLEQALVNLGGNALKHSRSRVVLGARRVDGRVLIEVTDSGVGIPPWEQSRVFDRFYRVGDREGDGFGLGLAIVREAVEALNGELELDSSPNGTRVSILLPGARVRVT